MGKSQRTKGQTGEREVCHILSDHFNREIKREIGQARDGGMDIDLLAVGVEVKRRKSLKLLRDWMTQIKKAVRKGQTPLVVAREDNGEWLAILPLTDLLDMLPEQVYNAVALKFACKPTTETEN